MKDFVLAGGFFLAGMLTHKHILKRMITTLAKERKTHGYNRTAATSYNQEFRETHPNLATVGKLMGKAIAFFI